MLAEVGLLREAASEARELLAGSDASQSVEGLGASDLVGLAVARLSSHECFAPFVEPLRNAQAELEDVVAGLRHQEEGLEEDPERLEALRRRLQLFSELRRKYGPSLGDVVEFAEASGPSSPSSRLQRTSAPVCTSGGRPSAARLAAAERRLGDTRREAAPKLAAAVEAHLQELAMPGARLEVLVGEDPAGRRSSSSSAPIPGEPALPLSKVASGGELARAMLATRLVVSAAPPTLVFDEVDAGVGGEAALAVGRALAALGRDHQVLVVTHLAQVAAFADTRFVVKG